MADREPPPMDVENSRDEDDLFADADDPKPEAEQNEVVTEKTKVPVDVNLDSDKEEEDEDLFSGGGTEVKLESDEESPAPEPSPAPVLTMETPQEEEPVTPIPTISASEEKEEQPKLNISQSATTQPKPAPRSSRDEDKIEEDPYTMDIKVIEPHKVGDGMSAYVVYKIITKTSIPAFRKPELIVIRRFSDFLGLYEKLREKHCHYGRIVPPAPEKSLVGMTKVKMSKEESGSADFLERRRAALERYLVRTAAHPVLRMDPDFREFLEKDGELPKATNTSALSGAGVKRLLSKVGDAMEKITFKMDESDEYTYELCCNVIAQIEGADQLCTETVQLWFEEKQQQIENLDQQLKKLHNAMETLVVHRRDLSQSTAIFAKSCAMLGNAEEHTALSRALSQLAETEEKIEVLQKEQSDQDFYTMAELLKDYISLMGGVKEILHERVKTYKGWKEAEATLTKKRENKAKLELAHKTDKISQAEHEITDWVQRVEKGQKDFENISATVRKEIARFDRLRVSDFKTSVIKYLEVLMEKQQQMIKHWEAFLPEAKAIA